MPKLGSILIEIKGLLEYQVKLLELLVENSGYGKAPKNLDETMEKVTKMMFPQGMEKIIPKEVMTRAVKLAKEINKED